MPRSVLAPCAIVQYGGVQASTGLLDGYDGLVSETCPSLCPSTLTKTGQPSKLSKGGCTVSDFVTIAGTVIALTILLGACAVSDNASQQSSFDPQTMPSEKLSTQELEGRIRSAAEKIQDLKHRLQKPSPTSGTTSLERGAASLGDSLGKVILRRRLEQIRKRLQADVDEFRKRRTQSLIQSEIAYLEAIRARVHPDIYPLFELAVLRGVSLERRADFVRSILQFQYQIPASP